MVSHVSGSYEARDAIMAKYLAEAQRLADRFKHFVITRGPRAKNTQADALAKLASERGTEEFPSGVEKLPFRTVTIEDIATTEVAPN